MLNMAAEIEIASNFTALDLSFLAHGMRGLD